jgi:hypothetical protein
MDDRYPDPRTVMSWPLHRPGAVPGQLPAPDAPEAPLLRADAPSGLPAVPVHETTWSYRGYHSDGGVCGVRLYRLADGRALFLLTELPENENTSITNMSEYLVAEVALHFLKRWDVHARPEAPPFLVVEHYPADDPYSDIFSHDRYALVTYAHYRPELTPRHAPQGRVRPTLGGPAWTHVAADALRATLGIEPPEAHICKRRLCRTCRSRSAELEGER